MTEQFFTVSELNQLIKDVIQAGFPQLIWVCGEVQQYDRNKNKTHVFFNLVEKDKESNDVKACIGLVIFANRRSHIENVLRKSENAFVLKDDIEVKFACRVDFYAPHGAVRLIVEDIDPVYTLGKMAQERQRLIAFLQKKGIFDKNKKFEIPLVPLNIGLITAYDSAAYNDFISELQKSRYGFRVYLRNALVQGKKAETDVSAALDDLQNIAEIELIVITRGGGSISDLACFDSQVIAEKVAACRVPVLSGIGHEINTTITDLAAHTFAKTPTAVAQFLVHRVEAFITQLENLNLNLNKAMENRFAFERRRLKDRAYGLSERAVAYFKTHHLQLMSFSEMLRQKPFVLVKDSKRRMQGVEADLLWAVERRIHDAKQSLHNYEKIINVVHPINILKRGFSITRDESGQVIRRKEEIGVGEKMITEVFQGKISSRVE